MKRGRHNLVEIHAQTHGYQPTCLCLDLVGIPLFCFDTAKFCRTVNRWLSARFNVLSSLIVGLTAVTILITPGTNAAMAGFAMSFANTIAHELLFVVGPMVGHFGSS